VLGPGHNPVDGQDCRPVRVNPGAGLVEAVEGPVEEGPVDLFQGLIPEVLPAENPVAGKPGHCHHLDRTGPGLNPVKVEPIAHVNAG